MRRRQRHPTKGGTGVVVVLLLQVKPYSVSGAFAFGVSFSEVSFQAPSA